MWWYSRTLGSAEKTRWLQSAVSHPPSGPDPGWLMPGCEGKQTQKELSKQTMPAGVNKHPPHQHCEQLSSPRQRRELRGMTYWLLRTHTRQWSLLMKTPPNRATLCARLLLLRTHKSVGWGLLVKILQRLALVLQHLYSTRMQIYIFYMHLMRNIKIGAVITHYV